MTTRPILAPLKLRGVGTAAVESLEHYGARLAFAHNVSPARVFSLARDVAVAKELMPPARTFSFATVAGYGAYTQAMVDVLHTMTGTKDLQCGTLLAVGRVLSKSLSGAFSRNRRWCPTCYLLPTLERYDKLAWQLDAVTTCPVDGMRLDSACVRCGARQLDFRSLEDDRYHCHQCSAALGHEVPIDRRGSDWERWSDAAAGELLCFTANPDSVPIDGNPWCEFLTQIKTNGHLPADVNLAAFKAFTWKAQRARPRLKTVFGYSALQSVMPLHVLQDPLGAASPILSLAASIVPPRRQVDQNLSQQQRRLQYVADVLVTGAEGWHLPLPGWLARAFGCTGSSWSKSDPPGYAAYHARVAVNGKIRGTSPERYAYWSACSELIRQLEGTGTMTFDELVQHVQASKRGLTRDHALRAVQQAVLCIGMFRQLCEDRPFQLETGRPRAGKPET